MQCYICVHGERTVRAPARDCAGLPRRESERPRPRLFLEAVVSCGRGHWLPVTTATPGIGRPGWDGMDAGDNGDGRVQSVSSEREFSGDRMGLVLACFIGILSHVSQCPHGPRPRRL